MARVILQDRLKDGSIEEIKTQKVSIGTEEGDQIGDIHLNKNQLDELCVCRDEADGSSIKAKFSETQDFDDVELKTPDIDYTTGRGFKILDDEDIATNGKPYKTNVFRVGFTPGAYILNSIKKKLITLTKGAKDNFHYFLTGNEYAIENNVGITPHNVTSVSFTITHDQVSWIKAVGVKTTTDSTNVRLRVWEGADDTGKFIFDSQNQYCWDNDNDQQPLPSTLGTLFYVIGDRPAFLIPGITYYYLLESKNEITALGDVTQPQINLLVEDLEVTKIVNDLDLTPNTRTSNFEMLNVEKNKVDTSAGTINVTLHEDFQFGYIGDYDRTWGNTKKVLINVGIDTIEFDRGNRGREYMLVKEGNYIRVYDDRGRFKSDAQIS